ncbi:HAMP domain-containing sensor histidine kinase [Streptomyces sp. NPDC005728]|uniref:HAMP domain-containing sensor histidine kinase n=1 Tax=Streptomyces sp. NPDC005728 TaxID=3157054 RepID=UPI0033FB22B0
MRQRVVRVAVTAVLVALFLLAIPLALAIRSSLYADRRDSLERSALAAAVRVNPDYAAGDPVEMPPPGAGERLGLYDPALRLHAGSGPRSGDAAVRRSLDGVIAHVDSGGELVVAVPVSHDEKVIGVVRASSAVSAVRDDVLVGWAVLLAAAVLALAVGVFVARRQAHALAQPLEELSRHCQAVAAGDLASRAAPSTIAEIDQVARTHNDMLHNLSELLRHERNFTTNASHQLRTPLTGLQLTLEAGLAQDDDRLLRPVLEEALAGTRRLHRTVEEVLRLASAPRPRNQATPHRPVAELLEETDALWHGLFAQDGRRLECSVHDLPADLRVPGAAVAEILGVLLDNARMHGRGSVRVAVRDLEEAVAVDVTDEGVMGEEPARLFARGHTGGAASGTGIGLALARDLAIAVGGRLFLACADPTTFTLLVPVRKERRDMKRPNGDGEMQDGRDGPDR